MLIPFCRLYRTAHHLINFISNNIYWHRFFIIFKVTLKVILSYFSQRLNLKKRRLWMKVSILPVVFPVLIPFVTLFIRYSIFFLSCVSICAIWHQYLLILFWIYNYIYKYIWPRLFIYIRLLQNRCPQINSLSSWRLRE